MAVPEAQVQATLKQLEAELKNIEQHVEPLSLLSSKDLAEKLSCIENAKLNLALAYSLSSLYHSESPHFAPHRTYVNTLMSLYRVLCVRVAPFIYPSWLVY